MSRPLKVQIVERARELIADEQFWCRRHFGEDVNGFAVSPTSASAVKRCGLGAVIARLTNSPMTTTQDIGLDTKRCGRITAPQH